MGWRIYPKRPAGGKYSYYANKCCFLIVRSGNIKIVITPATFELLGKPERVLLLSNGENAVGLRGIKKNDPQFDEAFFISSTHKTDAMHYVSAQGFVSDNNLSPNTVCENVYLEGDVLVAHKDDFRLARFKA